MKIFSSWRSWLVQCPLSLTSLVNKNHLRARRHLRITRGGCLFIFSTDSFLSHQLGSRHNPGLRWGSDILKLINSCCALSSPGCHDVNYANHDSCLMSETHLSPHLSEHIVYCNYNLKCTNIATVSLMESVTAVIIRCHVTLTVTQCHAVSRVLWRSLASQDWATGTWDCHP